jgi:hypothetical protein
VILDRVCGRVGIAITTHSLKAAAEAPEAIVLVTSLDLLELRAGIQFQPMVGFGPAGRVLRR